MSTVKNVEKALVVSRRESIDLQKLLIDNDLKIVSRDPDFVVAYGGDGTVLFSERTFPQVPKLIVKTSKRYRPYDYTLAEIVHVLAKIRHGEFQVKEEMKLETTVNDTTLIALNEVQVRVKLPVYALRFSVLVDKREFPDLIGDGVVVATPFGSTGYYTSTGGKRFSDGIGVSFNNLHNKLVLTHK